MIAVQPCGKQLQEVIELIRSGTVRPIVSKILPLEKVQEAHSMLETTHTRGKIILQL